ncbi:hypothetical protein MHYP_G00211490 [Metynnis hypsauchen]
MTSSCQQTPTCPPTPDPHAGSSDVPGLRFISVSASQPARERAALEQSVLARAARTQSESPRAPPSPTGAPRACGEEALRRRARWTSTYESA